MLISQTRSIVVDAPNKQTNRLTIYETKNKKYVRFRGVIGALDPLVYDMYEQHTVSIVYDCDDVRYMCVFAPARESTME